MMSCSGTSDVAEPEIVTDDIAPVMVGRADGIVEIGENEGAVVGVKVGAAVMKISQSKI